MNQRILAYAVIILSVVYFYSSDAVATEFDGLWGCVDANSIAPEPYVFLQQNTGNSDSFVRYGESQKPASSRHITNNIVWSFLGNDGNLFEDTIVLADNGIAGYYNFNVSSGIAPVRYFRCKKLYREDKLELGFPVAK